MFHKSLWKPPSARLSLVGEELHVWRVALDLDVSLIEQLDRHLESDEKKRTQKYYFERDRNNFRVARAVLRDIISRYLGGLPGEIRFSYNDYGKPSIDAEMKASHLHFNLSHSGNQAIYIFANGCEVGIDLELINSDFDCLDIAENFSSAAEIEIITGLPIEKQRKAFYKFWTCKESFIKLLGRGLSYPLNRFTIPLTPFGIRHQASAAINSAEGCIFLREMQTEPDYVAAIAVKRPVSTIQHWNWTQI